MEKQWAYALIELIMKRLQAEYENSGRSEMFTLLRASLTRDDSSMGYAEIAARLDSSTAAIKMTAMRMRARYQALLREEIARTVASPEEIEDELRHLFSALSN